MGDFLHAEDIVPQHETWARASQSLLEVDANKVQYIQIKVLQPLKSAVWDKRCISQNVEKSL